MISNRYSLESKKPVVNLPKGALEAIAEFQELVETSKNPWCEVDCIDGSARSEAILVSQRDRYGFPLETRLSRNSGLMWTSPRYSDSLLNAFYDGFFQRIYRGENDLIALRFANQTLRSMPLVEMLMAARESQSFEGCEVVDLGCGAGGMLTVFEELGASVRGIDLGGRDYLEYGKKRGLDLRQGDSSILIGEKTPDIVFLSHVLEHVPNPIETLKEIASVLPEGGLIGIQVPGIFSIDKTYGSDTLKFLQNSHLYHFSRKTLENILSMSGFSVVKCDEDITCVARKNSKGAVIDWDPKHHEEIWTFLSSIEKDRVRPKMKGKCYRFLKKVADRLPLL